MRESTRSPAAIMMWSHPDVDSRNGQSCHTVGLVSDVIRIAAPSDARAIAVVQVAGWHASYRGLVPDAMLDAFTVEAGAPKWSRNLTDAKGAERTTVLERDGSVVAFATVGPSREEHGASEVWALYAVPNVWSTGAGPALLDDGLRFLESCRYTSAMLNVLEGNARAIRFYERAGLQVDGDAFERDGLRELRMRCVLPRGRR